MKISTIFIIFVSIILLFAIIGLFFLKGNQQYSFILKITIIILLVIVILFIIYRIYYYFARIRINEPLLISGEINARGGISFPAKIIPPSYIGSEYSYSFWLYPSGWDYRFGKPKHILSRGSDPRKINNSMFFNPGIWFYPQSSNLMIRFDTYGKNKNFIEKSNSILNYNRDIDTVSENEGEENNYFRDLSLNDCKKQCLNNSDCQGVSYNYGSKECHISKSSQINANSNIIDSFLKTGSMNPYQLGNENFNPNKECDLVELPLQRWSHVVVVLWNRTTDIYLNGKLVRSCILDNVPKVPTNSPLYVCQDGGFDGKFGQLRYFNRALNADEIYHLYRKGPLTWKLLTSYEDNNAYVKGDKK